MAPEQLLGKPADERTDVFAFGAVLHEMVTGRRAFDGATIPQIASAIIHTDPAPASSLRADVPAALEDVSPDGDTLAYSERNDSGNFNLWTLMLSGPLQPAQLRPSRFLQGGLRYSPDGHHYTFLSSGSGRGEAYAAALAGPTLRVSTDGAVAAHWNRVGREILYLSPDGRMESVPVRTAPALELGTPSTLFGVGARGWIDFDVAPDGKRFLALIPEVVAAEQPLTAILGWSAPAKR